MRGATGRASPAPPRRCARIHKEEPQHRRAVAAIRTGVDAGFTGRSFWGPFSRAARRDNVPRVTNWLDTTDRILEDQWTRRGLRSMRPADMPLTTSAGRLHPPYPRLPLHTPLRAQEPRAAQPPAVLMLLHANRQDTSAQTRRTSASGSKPTADGPEASVAPSSTPLAPPPCVDYDPRLHPPRRTDHPHRPRGQRPVHLLDGQPRRRAPSSAGR
jgi:hypothetical protein